MSRRSATRFALIGFGGIGRTLVARLAREQAAGLECVGVLVRDPRVAEVQRELADGCRAVSRISELLALAPSLVAECGGHQALRQYGEAVLGAACGLVTISSGAFADSGLETRLRRAACEGGGRILLPAGALAGIDGLAAARHGGLTSVTYTGRKPVAAWRGTAAERAITLESLTEPAAFFDGDARQAARDYPQNANVAATIALAGVGFEATRVRLVADPAGSANLHELVYEGAFGRARIEIAGRPSPENPRTSLLTALSVWRALLDEAGASILIAGA